jgi:phosphopantothenoylcysteine decarboxylase/phosphopantothenate--cysteine ligase
MDLDMFAHPSTQNNLQIIRSFGNVIIEPQTGELASGLSGPGRLEEPDAILKVVKGFLTRRRDLDKKKVLITAGPTNERIDPVRFIGNYSTGMMGFCLAEEAAGRGAMVTLITGPTHLSSANPHITRINIESAQEMYEACMAESKHTDIVIMAAAVADYTFEDRSKAKLKKSNAPLELKLSPTRDILMELGKHKTTEQLLVGFALETDHGVENAKKKIKSKNLDIIVLNSLKDEGAGFGLETNKISIINRSGKVHQGKLNTKPAVAKEIIDFIVKNRM